MNANQEVKKVLYEIISKIGRTENNSRNYKGIRKEEPNAAENRMKRDKERHPILPPCEPQKAGSKKGCTKKCAEKITPKMRQEIYDNFWNMSSKDGQDAWMGHMFEVIDPARPRLKTAGKKEKYFTRIYYLEAEDTKLRVCQKMFLGTLGLKSDKRIETVHKKTANTRVISISDNRGKHEPSNKFGEVIVNSAKEHIKKYNLSISHYRRNHAPKRLYISPEFSATSMHKDYCESYPDKEVSYPYYYNMIKSMNISFVKLGEEECE